MSALALVLGVGLAACVEGPEPEMSPPEALETRAWPLDAFCTAEVRGVGARDVESDYIASVVSCENGGADFEALKAQAVAARTYLYFKLETSGDIADGTSDQVYSCSRPPQDDHRRAALETQGEVLRYNGITLAGFYVAGAIPTTPDCVPSSSDSDPTSTERFVTYNEGRGGDAVQPTSLGHPANPRNRGCKSQNGAHCLAGRGWGYQDILRFYYGEDVEFEIAEGPCVDRDPEDDALCDDPPCDDEAPLDEEDDDPTPDAGVPDAGDDSDDSPEAPRSDSDDAPLDEPGDSPDAGEPPSSDGGEQGEQFTSGVRTTDFREGCAVVGPQPTSTAVFSLCFGLALLARRRRRLTSTTSTDGGLR